MDSEHSASPASLLVLKRFLLAIFSLSLTLGCGELFCQLLKLNRQRLGEPIIVDHDILHHAWGRNFSSDALTINGQRWVEDYDIEVAKPEGVYRIFHLGDSNTQGLVPPGSRLPDIIERRLKESFEGDGTKFEVVNTGTSSYSTLIYFLLLTKYIIQFDPDLVVINFDMTDVSNDSAYRTVTIFDEDGIPEAIVPSRGRAGFVLTPYGPLELSPWRLFWWKLSNRSALFSESRALASRLAPKAPVEEYDLYEHGRVDESANWLALEWDDGVRENIAFSMDLLARIAAFLRQHDVAFMLNGVPHFYQFSGKWNPAPHDALAALAEREHIPYLNAFEALKPVITGTKRGDYYLDATHFNEKGISLWADAQFEFMLQHRGQLIP